MTQRRCTEATATQDRGTQSLARYTSPRFVVDGSISETPMKPCCDRMKEELERTCAHGHSPSECPDVLIAYVAKFDEFGIRVHDGGSSIVRIAFCPWCGTRLPESKRDRWFDELERRGIDPYEHEVPTEFRSDAWYAQTQPKS